MNAAETHQEEVAQKSAEWMRVMRERGHTPVVHESGDLNLFVENDYGHNGPGCSVCGWKACWHCDTIPEATVPETCPPSED